MTDHVRLARDNVLAAPAVHGVRIVGIDGPAGAGKSTLALRLAALLDAPVIQVHDFVSWNNFAAWWPRFDHQVLDPLLQGMAAITSKGTGTAMNSASRLAVGRQ